MARQNLETPAHAAAREWLKDPYHRDMWRVMTGADRLAASHAETIPPENADPDDLDKLSFLNGKAEGMTEVVDLVVRAWVANQQLTGVEPSVLWLAISELWEN